MPDIGRIIAMAEAEHLNALQTIEKVFMTASSRQRQHVTDALFKRSSLPIEYRFDNFDAADSTSLLKS